MPRMKPILFNTEMVQANLNGIKSATRRVAFPNKDLRRFPCPDNPDAWLFRGRVYTNWNSAMRSPQGVLSLCKYKKGDILYVRETWDNEPVTPGGHFRQGGVWYYKADGDLRPEAWRGNWHPSIHMPKEAARLFLKVTNVWVERLQDITEEQARSEGAIPFSLSVDDEETPDTERFWYEVGPALPHFITIWDSTIKKSEESIYGWDANPWVWVIEYERCEKPEGM